MFQEGGLDSYLSRQRKKSETKRRVPSAEICDVLEKVRELTDASVAHENIQLTKCFDGFGDEIPPCFGL